MQRHFLLCANCASTALRQCSQRSAGPRGVLEKAVRRLSFQSRKENLLPNLACTSAAPSFEAKRQRRPPRVGGRDGEDAFCVEDFEFDASLAFSEVSSANHAALWSGLAKTSLPSSNPRSGPAALCVEASEGEQSEGWEVDEESRAVSVQLLQRRLDITADAASERDARLRELRLRLPKKRRALGLSSHETEEISKKPSLLERLALAEKAALMKPRGKGSTALLPLKERQEIIKRETGRQSREQRRRAARALPRVLVLKVCDVDAVSANELNHAFMLLLVQQLPAEQVLKVLTRVARYRDQPSQRVYECLSRDFTLLVGSRLLPETAATAAAFLSRTIHTLPLPWAVDFVRRFGAFSKEFLAKQIEKATQPRFFDFVRYQKHGGLRPLPPIVRYPYRLSSYVHLLGECSVKKFMYVHLKRHGLLPPHQLLEQERLGRRLAEERLLPLSANPSSDALIPLEMRTAERLSEDPSIDGKVESSRQSLESRARVKRPALYDLILAAEHMGLDYKELLPTRETTPSSTALQLAFKRSGGDAPRNASSAEEEEGEFDAELEGDGSPFLLQQTRVAPCVLRKKLAEGSASNALTEREDPETKAEAQGTASLESDEPPKERPWYQPPFTVRGTFFRLRGKAFALTPEEGWKQLPASENSRQWRPRRRRTAHAVKRLRRRERLSVEGRIRRRVLAETDSRHEDALS